MCIYCLLASIVIYSVVCRDVQLVVEETTFIRFEEYRGNSKRESKNNDSYSIMRLLCE